MKKKNKIIIAGGSGLVGQAITSLLQSKGYEVIWLSRESGSQAGIKRLVWNPYDENLRLALPEDTLAVINLAGAGIADHYWTKAYKKELAESRIKSTAALVKAIGKQSIHLINASAIGFYPQHEGESTEETEAGTGFLCQLCADWEKEAQKAPVVSIVRIGIVLSERGGFIPKVSLPIKWGLGAVLGSGKQMISWIHVDDLASLFCFVLEHQLLGVWNAAAPSPESNRAITKQLAKKLRRPILFPPIPAFALKLIFGELSIELLSSHRVSSAKIRQAGFQFKYPQLSDALSNL